MTMKKLSLSDVANIAEVVGAAAIVVSLNYVGQELKANTTSAVLITAGQVGL